MFKKAVFIIILLFVNESTKAQEEVKPETKKAIYGFNFGINRTSLDYESKNSIKENREVGFRLGILAEYKLSSNLFFSPKTELSFNQNLLEINESVEYDVMPISTEIMAHFAYKFSGSELRPYILFGPNFKIPFGGEEETTSEFKTSPDLALDFGIGFERNFKYFFFAPELRYSYGLMDINKNPLLNAVYLHNLTLVLNFKG